VVTLRPLLLFALALLLRAWGLDWGLPNATRLFSYHPDETMVVAASTRVNPLAGRLDPQFYNYGSLSLLINGAAIALGRAAGLVSADPFPGAPAAGALLVARLVTALLGAATCVLLLGAGRRLYNERAGLVAGALYAVAPLAVQHGHFATVDVPATFFATGALFFAARHLTTPSNAPPAYRDLLLAGLCAGLATATKYNAGLVLLAGIAAWWLRTSPPVPLSCKQAEGGIVTFASAPGTPSACLQERGTGGEVWTSLAALVAAALTGFLFGCPGALLNTPRFLADLGFEAEHVRTGHGLVFVNTLPGWLHHVVANLPWALGHLLALLAVVAVIGAVVRRRPGDVVLLVFMVPYYLLVGAAEVKFARYLLPILPPLVLLVAAFFSGEDAPGGPRWRVPRLGLLALGTAHALLLSLGFNEVMTRPDPRDQAAAYVRQAGVPSVGFATGPWFYSPTLGPLLTAPIPEIARTSALSVENPRLVPAGLDRNGDGRISNDEATAWDVDLLQQTMPAAIALSELNEYADVARARHAPALHYLDVVQATYANRRVFARPVQVFGLPLAKPRLTAIGLPAQPLPHDMTYTNPTTVIFSR
jgi:hypothetical protein